MWAGTLLVCPSLNEDLVEWDTSTCELKNTVCQWNTSPPLVLLRAGSYSLCSTFITSLAVEVCLKIGMSWNLLMRHFWSVCFTNMNLSKDQSEMSFFKLYHKATSYTTQRKCLCRVSFELRFSRSHPVQTNHHNVCNVMEKKCLCSNNHSLDFFFLTLTYMNIRTSIL